MKKLSEQEIKNYAEWYKSQATKEELQSLLDSMAKSDKKARNWIYAVEIVLTYLGLGLIWYNYGWGLALCIWMINVAQVIGILKAEAKGNAISRLYKREGNVTIEAIIEEANDKWESKKK